MPMFLIKLPSNIVSLGHRYRLTKGKKTNRCITSKSDVKGNDANEVTSAVLLKVLKSVYMYWGQFPFLRAITTMLQTGRAAKPGSRKWPWKRSKICVCDPSEKKDKVGRTCTSCGFAWSKWSQNGDSSKDNMGTELVLQWFSNKMQFKLLSVLSLINLQSGMKLYFKFLFLNMLLSWWPVDKPEQPHIKMETGKYETAFFLKYAT